MGRKKKIGGQKRKSGGHCPPAGDAPAPVCDVFELHNFTQCVSKIYTFPLLTPGLSPLPKEKSWLCGNTQVSASDLPIHSISVPQKNSDDVTACDLWFAPPPSIKNPGYAYVTKEIDHSKQIAGLRVCLTKQCKVIMKTERDWKGYPVQKPRHQ